MGSDTCKFMVFAHSGLLAPGKTNVKYKTLKILHNEKKAGKMCLQLQTVLRQSALWEYNSYCFVPSQSRSLFWGMFELVIKESWGERSVFKAFLSLSFPPLPARALRLSHFLLSPFQLVSSSRASNLFHAPH